MTTTLVIRYETHAEAADDNQRLVEAVYDELAATDPGGLHYLTFRLADGTSFVHIAVVDGTDNPLTASAAFAAFQEGLADRCRQQPVATPATLVGAYRFLPTRSPSPGHQPRSM